MKADVLDGPVGQLAVAELVLGERAMALDYALSALADPEAFRRRLADTAHSRFEELRDLVLGDPLRVVGVFGKFVESVHHGYAPQGHDRFGVLASCTGILRPVARLLSEAPELSWWWSPVGSVQRVTESGEGRRVDVAQLNDEAAMNWWTAPMTSRTLQTTRGPILGAPSVSAVMAEDLATARPDTWEYAPPLGDVVELSHPRDWAGLVAQFPMRVAPAVADWSQITGRPGPWYQPDWARVAECYSGAHLSVAAYLATAYRAIEFRDGWTVLSGWNPDATVWFDTDWPPKSTT
ncbi:hypothetical protein [Rarobacter incanus]|uniref:Uncharacterized protein n=1 Tax=Rarobacter incanus TaxID=153494 RepID=A0A542SPH5_9MICO|nr:hypothetical protein [Rarobacter incanus]TQK76157.1 hypothetical protein FB389_0816 [Rarobacter incanus]